MLFNLNMSASKISIYHWKECISIVNQVLKYGNAEYLAYRYFKCLVLKKQEAFSKFVFPGCFYEKIDTFLGFLQPSTCLSSPFPIGRNFLHSTCYHSATSMFQTFPQPAPKKAPSNHIYNTMSTCSLTPPNILCTCFLPPINMFN